MSKSLRRHYDALCQHFQTISHFEHFSILGDWDQATMMPKGGSEPRSDAMATLAKHIHQLKTQPDLAEHLAAAAQAPLSAIEQANVREMNYQYHQANVVPAQLVEAQTKTGYRCENAWREQRKNNDWQGFKPNLEAVIALTREEAQIRSEALGVSPYDALLDKFEPGMTSEKLESTFGQLKTWLPQLITQVVDKQASEAKVTIQGPFPIEGQQALSRELMQLLGFDFDSGRLDCSSHPFSSGVPGDLRITTRYDEQDFTSAVMGTIHETGHACYEQGLPKTWRGQPVGLARSMGIHESQSLFFEMQLGRGQGFLKQLLPRLNQQLNTHYTQAQLANIYSRVNPGKIRVDADEVTYPCHILLRFEAEKALIDGSLAVADLPDFWSSQMQSLLGINTDGDYQNGCMQDIHWTLGELGYFPSYTLGAMYAAQFKAKMESQIGDIDSLVADNQLTKIIQWLEDNIWSQGSILTTDELVIQATGEALNPIHFQQHLSGRYL
ncbi:carboxypeptidase M32 [Shewanella sp. Isolate11]|uniref:carboxypeptidase M32 n=1 Tax=Shewanella sp. Isolate11 TaxID=2908530 RepID=UPI001EFD0024|nr:carboxypeptidase M32 [Shewanella sp. Isolate11]MCG9695854.1 carboxypeptidase M32 [Shewanella sp. Isolate11]